MRVRVHAWAFIPSAKPRRWNERGGGWWATRNKEELEEKFGQGGRVEGWGHKRNKGPGEAADGVWSLAVNIVSSAFPPCLMTFPSIRGGSVRRAWFLKGQTPMLR